jgi:hypothetical protein
MGERGPEGDAGIPVSSYITLLKSYTFFHYVGDQWVKGEFIVPVATLLLLTHMVCVCRVNLGTLVLVVSMVTWAPEV